MKSCHKLGRDARRAVNLSQIFEARRMSIHVNLLRPCLFMVYIFLFRFFDLFENYRFKVYFTLKIIFLRGPLLYSKSMPLTPWILGATFWLINAMSSMHSTKYQRESQHRKVIIPRIYCQELIGYSESN